MEGGERERKKRGTGKERVKGEREKKILNRKSERDTQDTEKEREKERIKEIVWVW